MLDGSGPVLGQMAVLSLIAVAIGAALGRYAWPRRPSRRDTLAVPVSPVPKAFEGHRSEPVGPAVSALISDARARAGQAELQVSQARAWAAELQARLTETQAALKETEARLGQTETELLQTRRQVQGLEDRKEAEMGRLESGAIAALEATMATHREQVATLEEKLRATQATVEMHIRELAIEHNRCTQLRSALAERDQHIAALTNDQA